MDVVETFGDHLVEIVDGKRMLTPAGMLVACQKAGASLPLEVAEEVLTQVQLSNALGIDRKKIFRLQRGDPGVKEGASSKSRWIEGVQYVQVRRKSKGGYVASNKTTLYYKSAVERFISS